MSRSVIACIGAVFVLAGSTASFAGNEPEYRGRRGDSIPSSVTADSRYGSETITAPVRRAANADRLEVRLPGGTWVDCHLDCSETLRRETVDFWQNHNERYGGDGPGYFVWHRSY